MAGRQYDKDGNLKQWWTTGVINKFKQQAQCIINQYGNFTVPEAEGLNVSMAKLLFNCCYTRNMVLDNFV